MNYRRCETEMNAGERERSGRHSTRPQYAQREGRPDHLAALLSASPGCSYRIGVSMCSREVTEDAIACWTRRQPTTPRYSLASQWRMAEGADERRTSLTCDAIPAERVRDPVRSLGLSEIMVAMGPERVSSGWH